MQRYDPYENDPHHQPHKYHPFVVKNHDPRACFDRKIRKGFGDGTHGAFFSGMGPLVLIAIIAYFCTR